MVKLARSLLFLLGLTLLPACAAPERIAVPQNHAPMAAQHLQSLTVTSAALTRRAIVYFDSDSADIRAAAMQILHGTAVDLRGARLIAIRVTGFTDGAGRRSYNQKLSERRAAAVADQLDKLGLRAGRIEVKGAGETKGKPRRNYADRRVEVTFEFVEAAAASPLHFTPSLDAADDASTDVATPHSAEVVQPAGEPAYTLTPTPLHASDKPAIKLLPVRDGTTWLPPPAT